MRDAAFEFLKESLDVVVPFALGQKLYLTTPSHHARYFEGVKAAFAVGTAGSLGAAYMPGKTELFGWPVMIHREGMVDRDTYERAILAQWQR